MFHPSEPPASETLPRLEMLAGASPPGLRVKGLLVKVRVAVLVEALASEAKAAVRKSEVAEKDFIVSEMEECGWVDRSLCVEDWKEAALKRVK